MNRPKPRTENRYFASTRNSQVMVAAHPTPATHSIGVDHFPEAANRVEYRIHFRGGENQDRPA